MAYFRTAQYGAQTNWTMHIDSERTAVAVCKPLAVTNEFKSKTSKAMIKIKTHKKKYHNGHN